MIGVRATGVLRTFAEAGVLEAADVHVALRLARLGQETRDDVLLAVALAVRGVRTGSVCVELAHLADTVVPDPETGTALPWPSSWDSVADSPLVAVGVEAAWAPLRLVDGLLYLDRYFVQEQLVRHELDARAAQPPPSADLTDLDVLFPEAGPDRQRLAVQVAAGRWVSVITGGPGTGKTHTVARLLSLLLAQPGPPLRIALAAPTGKAAARLQESVRAQAAELGLPTDLTASTLHRLLGWRPDSHSRFRHDATNRLPFDVVVVDESSMVSLTLMARLVDAVRPTARLVLVGDPDQLTPVDAGAVLSDLVHRPPAPEAPVLPTTEPLDDAEHDQLRNGVVRLVESHRYGTGIGDLAEAVRTGDADVAVALLQGGGVVELVDDPDASVALRAEVTTTGAALTAAARDGDTAGALALLGAHRLLCAHREGPFGVAWWNEQCSRWLGATGGQWYPGQPLLVMANDHEHRLYNGDTGVVVRHGGELRAAFSAADDPLPLSRLSAVATAHALTVHRSQGSQYAGVTLLLPPAESPLLTRELFYTAITRASERVRVVGTEASVRAAVERRLVRASGLRRR